MIHGDVGDDMRRQIRRRFWLPREDADAVDLLLCSEVGAEGLDYQCCDALVNYDLPWNPARIEQRIGRIDRHGQTSPVIAIWNLITPGTVDADIYERCLVRIGVFRRALGGSEEILGRLMSGLRHVAETLTLSEEAKAAQLQQLADNEVRALQEEAALEEREMELIGLRLPPREQDADVAESANFWLSPDRLGHLVVRYLRAIVGEESMPLLGEGDHQTLRVGAEARRKLLDDFRALPRRPSAIAREWEQWLKGGEPHLAVTFDAATATAEPRTVFITPVHPLAQQAAALERSLPIHTIAETVDGDVQPGSYPFAIYQWRMHGAREDAVLQPVCESRELSGRLIGLLAKAHPPSTNSSLPAADVFERLETQHHELWREALAAHADRCRQRALCQRESLAASHTARVRLLEGQLAAADNDKIRRMRESQLASAYADHERHLAEIENAETKADITTRPVAFGSLVIAPP